MVSVQFESRERCSSPFVETVANSSLVRGYCPLKILSYTYVRYVITIILRARHDDDCNNNNRSFKNEEIKDIIKK